MTGTILYGVFKATIGLLISKCRDVLAEKLKEGDVTDEKFRDWIVREIDAINSKLDSIAWKDLGASINFFKEGIVLMYEVFGKSGTEAAMEIEETHLDASLLGEGMKNVALTDADKSAKSALSEAKKRFKDARKKATEAYSNTALRPADRILAMQYRVMATLFENADNLSLALPTCKLHLAQLHSMPVVHKIFQVELRKSFKSLLSRDERNGIISAVCHINHIVYAIAQMVGDHTASLLDWPCISFKEEKLDLIRDVRVVKKLTKLQESEEGHKLPIPFRTEANSAEQFALIDTWNGEMKVFDNSGKHFRSILVSTDIYAALKVQCVAPTDRKERVSLLVDATDEVYVSDIQAKLSCTFPRLKKWLRVLSLAVNSKTDQVAALVEDPICTPSALIAYSTGCEVQVFGSDGRFVHRFGGRTLKGPLHITATNDGGFMVLQGNSCIHVFNAEGSHDHQFSVHGDTSLRGGAIVCCPLTGHVSVASLNAEYRLQVSIHRKDGSFLRNIQIQDKKDKRKWCITGITVTKKARIAVSIYDESEQKSKLVVV